MADRQVVTKFNRYYITYNPNIFEGPGTNTLDTVILPSARPNFNTTVAEAETDSYE